MILGGNSWEILSMILGGIICGRFQALFEGDFKVDFSGIPSMIQVEILWEISGMILG